MLACTALVGCTSEEIDNPLNGQENGVVGGKDKAYIAISIKNANNVASRATPGNYHAGSEVENAIKDNGVSFFFYKSDGTYRSMQKNLKPETSSTKEETTNANVEEVLNAVVVLEGLQDKGTPSYVVALLNAPDALISAMENKTLTQAQALLAGAETNLVTEGETTTIDYYNGIKNGQYFIMTNSSYNEASLGQFFATPITANHFLTEYPEKEDMVSTTVNENGEVIPGNVVDIYVERLAAKAKLTASGVEKNVVELTKYNVDGEDITLQVEIANWDFSGTTKNSYAFKNGVKNWSSLTSWTWDAKADHRSYWAESYNRTLTGATYPEGYKPGDDVNGYTLNYKSWSQLDVTIGGSEYCAENTNTIDALEANFNATATQVLVKATVKAKNAQGAYVPVNLVRYENILYTPDGYINQILLNENINVYTKADDPTTTDKVEYRSLSANDVTYVNLGNAVVYPVLTEAAAKLPWTKVENDAEGQAWTVEALNAELKGAETKVGEGENAKITYANQAEFYNGGMGYYNIPIEHIAGGKYTYDDNGVLQITNEGDYGVVRNHYYNIDITSIANLPRPVYNADEVIIPNNEDPTTYYIGAQIYILAWKVVNQNVKL